MFMLRPKILILSALARRFLVTFGLLIGKENPRLSRGFKKALAMEKKSTSCVIMELRSANLTKNNTGGIVMTRDDISSLAHSKWNCKYHVVFAPKYRRMVIYNQIKTDIGKILRKLCEQKGIEIIEAELCPDHIHMLIAIPPKYSVAQIMGYLKVKSSLMIFDRHANMKYKYGNRHFWCRGYYVDTVGKNTKRIAEYIRNQLQEDIANDQLTLFESIDPFTGEKYKKK